jgi:hypothetical protein
MPFTGAATPSPSGGASAMATSGKIAACSIGVRKTDEAAALPMCPSITRRLMPESGV